jgi:hypothetical protein
MVIGEIWLESTRVELLRYVFPIVSRAVGMAPGMALGYVYIELSVFESARRASRKERAAYAIAIRIDPDVLRELRKEATRRKEGYQTLVNRVLAEDVRSHVA